MSPLKKISILQNLFYTLHKSIKIISFFSNILKIEIGNTVFCILRIKTQVYKHMCVVCIHQGTNKFVYFCVKYCHYIRQI